MHRALASIALLGLLLSAALPALPALAALPPPAAPADAPLRVHVRVEGRAAQVWSGWVSLPASYAVTASNSGLVHTLDARTPLGALWAAGQAGGIALDISDEFDDLEALSVAGEYAWGTSWWDYRVDGVQTNYGPQGQWLTAGAPVHPLAEDSEVLWYVETHISAPLRMSDVSPSVGSGPCLRVERVEFPVVDPLHNAGQAWPTQVWGPVPLARLGGVADGEPVIGGLAAALVSGAGPVWAEDQALPVTPLLHLIRSERSALACPS